MIYRYNRGGLVTDYNGRYVTTLNGTSGTVRKQSINVHDWYGAIADLDYKKNNRTFNGGINFKTYKGTLYDIVTNMLSSNVFFCEKNS